MTIEELVKKIAAYKQASTFALEHAKNEEEREFYKGKLRAYSELFDEIRWALEKEAAL